eukprot:Sspe_Gene.18348::Locus_6582_Transcript_1_1_Confidence_1.000_Length_871::g.18348::m.18348
MDEPRDPPSPPTVAVQEPNVESEDDGETGEVNLDSEFDKQVADSSSRIKRVEKEEGRANYVKAVVETIDGMLLDVTLTEETAFEVTYNSPQGKKTERFDSINTMLLNVSSAARQNFANEIARKLGGFY